jgi:predicted ArsR family transcriptional regulator
VTTSQHLAFLLAVRRVSDASRIPPLGVLVLYRLRDNGPMLAARLAGSLGVTPSVADFSYRILISGGLIEICGRDPSTRGNPHRRFAITPAGRDILRRIGGDSFLLVNKLVVP